MKKLSLCLLNILLSGLVFGQTETFDIATYTAPKDWKKDANTGVVAYTNVNTTSGAFCILALYACSPSIGDAQKDFDKEWNDRVVIAHKATETNPKTETQTTADGWKTISGAAPIKLEGTDAYAILTVFSGFQKKFVVLTLLNDQSYLTGVDAFLENIKLDKKGKTSVTQTTIPTETKTNETTSQFGQVMYSIPNGWKVTKYPDGDILSPIDLPAGEFLEIWVQPTLSFSGTMEEALQKSFDETVEKIQAKKMNDVNGGNYSAQTAKTSFRGWEYIRCSGGIKMGAGEYPPEYGLDMFVIKVNERYEKISIVKSRKSCDYSTYYPTQRLKYYNDVENFFFSLKFPDWKEPVVKTGVAKGDGIAGIWQGISMSTGISKPGAELGAELKVKQLIFFSNGQAFFGTNFPTEGLEEMNTWAKAESNRRDWGTYSFSNGRGILKLPYGDIPLSLEGGKLIITTNKTDHNFIKKNSVDGAKFNGTYTMSSKTALGNETGITPLINFTADGNFTDNGALKNLYHEYVSCLNAANAPGSGTYEVKNYSVIFNYTDGRKIKIAFLGADYDIKDPSPATLLLSFNEDVLRRQ